METHFEIIKHTELQKPVNFVEKNKKNKTVENILSSTLHFQSKKLEETFEDNIPRGNDYLRLSSSSDEPNEGEITASILEVNGGPISTDYMIEKKFHNHSKLKKNISTNGLVEKIVKKNEIEKKTESIAAVSHYHPELDTDVYCLDDKIIQDDKKNDFYFEFRGKKTIENRNDYLLDSYTLEGFQFVKSRKA